MFAAASGRTLDPKHLQHAVELRHQRLHLRHIARLLAAPFSAVGRALNRLEVGRLCNLEPKPAVKRYKRETPGELIHIEVKKLACFRRIGHSITGNQQQGRSTGVGYDLVHVAIDDATRLAYVEVLEDEQKGMAIGFLNRAVAWFNGQGVQCRQVMSDNGPGYVSRSFAKACRVLGLKHIQSSFTRHAPTARLSALSRLCVGVGPNRCPSTTLRNGTAGSLGISRSITASGVTQPSAADPLSSGSTSCSADQRGETQQLE